jgi:hypothetical protein
LPPVDHFGFSAMMASPIQTNYRNTLANPNSRAAMAAEYDALIANGTWCLVP